MWKIVGAGFLCLLELFAVMWLVQGNEFFMMKFFAPKMEQVRRETFEQSKAYNQGMIQELRNAQQNYIMANANEKAALRSVILHQFADYDKNKLPSDLYEFMNSLQRAENGGL